MFYHNSKTGNNLGSNALPIFFYFAMSQSVLQWPSEQTKLDCCG